MRKSMIVLTIIISIISLISLLNGWNGTDGMQPLVNDFDAAPAGQTPTPPPIGWHYDWQSWELVGDPTPVIGGNIRNDPYYPTKPLDGAYHGLAASRIKWDNEQQYISLDHSLFENVGCNDPNYDPVAGTYTTSLAKDWSCYDYIVVYFHDNPYVNSNPESVSQPVSLYDGTVTYTVSVSVVEKNNSAEARVWDEHIGISLRYLRNQYINGNRFDTSNILRYVINAPDVPSDNYNFWNPLTGECTGCIIFYYDYLTLGADAMPNSPPSNVSASVIDGGGYDAAQLNWSYATQNGDHPITAYHIYRKIGTGDYQSLAFVSSNDNSYIDYEGNPYATTQTFCYKVLTCDQGPGLFSGTGDIITNTINATYNEALLEEATEVCVNLNPRPPTATPTLPGGTTLTPTPTGTWYTATITPTYTPTPTETNTPVPEEEKTLEKAHIYPNPFNPNMGSRKFHVGNVKKGTKIYIYSMAGELVNDGEIKEENATYSWDGRNKNNSKVVTGLYYLVLQAPDGETKVYKITVCYKCDPVVKPDEVQ